MPSDAARAPSPAVDGPAPGVESAAHLAEVASRVAVEAAELVRDWLGQARIVDTKSSPTDVVTQADLDVEALIRRGLLAATPGASITGEEEGLAGGSTPLRWIVDPIDGTVNFLYNLPVVSVSIAASLEGAVVAGAVVDVVRREVFVGSAGNRVTCNGVRVAPSPVVELADALVGTGFSYSAEQRRHEGDVVARVLPATRDIRNFGSAALHLAWVAAGRLEAFYQHDLNEYDVAAGAFLAAEAGAEVELGSADNRGLTLAAAPGVFAQLRSLVVG